MTLQGIGASPGLAVGPVHRLESENFAVREIEIGAADLQRESARPLPGGAGEVGDETITRMRQRLALGASNLEAALAFAGEQARAHAIARVVLLTDGVPTAGETAGDKLREKVVALRNSGVERLDAVALGGIRDDDLLKSLVNAGLPRGGVVVDGAMTEEEQWRRSDPEKSARADDMVSKLEAAIAQVETDLEQARGAGNDKKVRELEENLESRRSFLDMAKRAAADYS